MSYYDTPQPPKKRWGLIIVTVLVLAGGGWFWWSHQSGDKTADQQSNEAAPSGGGGRHGRGAMAGPVPVTIATAQKGTIDVTRQGLGTVTPLANITVRTQINGQLTEVAFQEGQMVEKGTFLAQIDPRPYQMALKQAEGVLHRDQALLKDAQVNLERYSKLVEEDSIARQQLDTQESLVQQYLGNVQTDQGQIDQARLNLAYCHITAPITGRVGLRQMDPGNYVQTGDANGLVTITQLQPISVLFTLPEDDIPMVMKRLNDGAQLTVSAFDRTQSTKLAEGKLTSVDNQINTATGSVKLRASFENADGMLFPNQFVNVTLLVDTLQDVVTIPSSAILHGVPGTFVYVVKDGKTVTIKTIKTGPSQDNNVAVLEGLSEGDQVVTGGSDKLREGAQIKLPGTEGNSSAAGAGDTDGEKKHHHHDKPAEENSGAASGEVKDGGQK